MNGKPAVLLLTGLLFACAPPPPVAPPAPAPAPAAPAPAAAPPAPAPVNHFVSIQGARCGALLALQPDDRQEASMFYVGYSARRFGSRAINVGMVPSIISVAISYCEAEPNRTVASAFNEAYVEMRRP
jgi:hypothetical protein